MVISLQFLFVYVNNFPLLLSLQGCSMAIKLFLLKNIVWVGAVCIGLGITAVTEGLFLQKCLKDIFNFCL